jgi:hypothetical protein
MLLETLDTGGIWSVARGLARNVATYKGHLARCDLPRRNDLDGRGSLSEEELADFTRFFLEVCIDQVDFMEELAQPDRLRTRILMWAEEEVRLGNLPPRAATSSKRSSTAASFRAERLPVCLAPPHVTRAASPAALADYGVLTSDGPRAPLRLAFPAALAPRWMPGLFPERAR